MKISISLRQKAKTDDAIVQHLLQTQKYATVHALCEKRSTVKHYFFSPHLNFAIFLCRKFTAF